MKWETLQSFVDRHGVFLIYDEMDVGPGFGLLRTLPALTELGVAEFTYPRSWRDMGDGREGGMLQYDYTTLDDLAYEGQVLAALTNQYYEDETQYSISRVINDWIDEGTLLVVADHKRFQTQQGLRPLYHEPFAITQRPYPTVYDAFTEWYQEQGFDLPLTDTMNLYLQDNAILYRKVSGETVTQSHTLFEQLDDAPYLPLYDAVSTAFQSEEGFGTSPKKEETLTDLAKWFRRRIEWDHETALSVVRTLNSHVAETTRAFDPTRVAQDASMADARREVTSLPDSPLGQKYKAWVQRERQ
jgi:hypothetical protein